MHFKSEELYLEIKPRNRQPSINYDSLKCKIKENPIPSSLTLRVKIGSLKEKYRFT